MIPTLIFSKDRAGQLRLLLESMQIHAPQIFQPLIIWKASNDEYKAGYQKLQMDEVADKCLFREEEGIVVDLYRFLHTVVDKKCALFMDDCIIYRPIYYPQHIINYLTDKTWCLSLRLGDNTKYQNVFTRERIAPLNIQRVHDGMVYWDFRDYRADENYGVHFSWDGVIYRAMDLLSVFNNNMFGDTDNPHAIAPQRIENYMMNRRRLIEKYKYMACPKESNVICMSWNATHAQGYVPDKFVRSLVEINNNYLNNRVIDLHSINFTNIESCHDQRAYRYRSI